MSLQNLTKPFIIGINIYNQYHGSHIPAMYIVNDSDLSSPEQNLTIEIKNETNKTLLTAPLSSTDPGENNFHFSLRWRMGTLSEHALKNVLTADNLSQLMGKDWKASAPIPRKHDGSIAIYFIYCGSTPETLGGQSVKMLSLKGISAAPGQGSRSTRVEVDYANLYFQGQKNVLLSGTRIQTLDIVNHRGQKNIPLHIGIVGSNTILNDGITPNPVTLRFKNVSNKTTLNFYSPNDPKNLRREFVVFSVSVDSEVLQIVNIDQPSIPNFNFSLDEKANPPVLTIQVTTSITLKPNESFEIPIILKTTKANIDGLSNLYCQYENIQGYWDGQVIVPILKSPLVKRGANVGIGTNVPAAKQHIVGAVLVNQKGCDFLMPDWKADDKKDKVIGAVIDGKGNGGQMRFLGTKSNLVADIGQNKDGEFVIQFNDQDVLKLEKNGVLDVVNVRVIEGVQASRMHINKTFDDWRK